MNVIRIMTIISGVILCFIALCLAATVGYVEKDAQPFFAVLICLCVIGAVFSFKPPKEAKTQAPKTHTTAAEGEFAAAQTTYTPSAVPNDVAKEMRKYYTLMQAQRDMEIMAESYRLASTTVNLETFCLRYDLAMQKAHTLLQAEQVGVRGIKRLNCHNACQQVINSGSALKVRVLHDYETTEMSKADALKTSRGRQSRYIKMLTELEKAESTFMFMDEYDALIEKVKNAKDGIVTDVAGYAHIETEYIPDFPKYPNEDTDIPGDAYLYDKTGKLIGRTDGKPLNDADCAYLVRAGYENAKKKAADMACRGVTQNIITDEILNPKEVLFFDCFSQKLLESNLNPGYVELDRLGSEAINVYYYNCYVGKIFIPEKEYIRKYRVLKVGNTRATRVFDNEVDAQKYVLGKAGYNIEVDTTKTVCWMQCLKANGSATVAENSDIAKMIDAIPMWIKYIKHYAREYNGATKL